MPHGPCKLLAAGALIAALIIVPGRAGAAIPASCGDDPPAYAFTGEFGGELQGSYVMVPFDVPGATTKIQLRLCHDQPESPTSSQIRHTLDLGIYAPTTDGFWDDGEFRGWGGSSRLDPVVTLEESTTVGFIPGPITAGEWAAEIGVAAVVPTSEGDSDGKVAWRLEVLLSIDPADFDEPYATTPYNTSPANTQPGWYRGDLHVHAQHSGPNDASMEETFDCAFGPRPESSGLDFMALSDYVTYRQWGEIGRFQDSYPGKLILRSAEVITYRGHLNNHSSVRWVDYRTGPIYELNTENGELALRRDPIPPKELFTEVRNAGGWTQVNHPTTFDSDVPFFGNICRGCSWEYSDEETDWILVDAMEVHTGPAGTPEPADHELGPNPFTPLAIEWWDRLRARGYPITAVGVSDSHHACDPAELITQSPIGEGTTVLFAEELSEKGIKQAILAGRAYVKTFAPDGPDLRLTARPSGMEGPEAMMGDSLFTEVAEFHARVLGAAPNPEPRVLLIMRDGLPILSLPVTSNDFTHTFSASEPGDYRLQLMRLPAVEGLTNPITLNRERLSKPGLPAALRGPSRSTPPTGGAGAASALLGALLLLSGLGLGAYLRRPRERA